MKAFLYILVKYISNLHKLFTAKNQFFAVVNVHQCVFLYFFLLCANDAADCQNFLLVSKAHTHIVQWEGGIVDAFGYQRADAWTRERGGGDYEGETAKEDKRQNFTEQIK